MEILSGISVLSSLFEDAWANYVNIPGAGQTVSSDCLFCLPHHGSGSDSSQITWALSLEFVLHIQQDRGSVQIPLDYLMFS